MKIEKETSGTKKQRKDSSTKKIQKRDKDSNVTANKECADSSETNVSVFRKSTNPNILISTENIKNDYNKSSLKKRNKYNILIFLCFIMMCIIILATFFISLQTYNTVKNLPNYILL